MLEAKPPTNYPFTPVCRRVAALETANVYDMYFYRVVIDGRLRRVLTEWLKDAAAEPDSRMIPAGCAPGFTSDR